MTAGFGLHRNGDVCHPHVLLVHGVGNPEVGVLWDAVALLDAADILRAIALVVAAIAHRWYFTLNEVQRGVFQTVARQ